MKPIEDALDYLTATNDTCIEVMGIEDMTALRLMLPVLSEVVGAVFMTMTAGAPIASAICVASDSVAHSPQRLRRSINQASLDRH